MDEETNMGTAQCCRGCKKPVLANAPEGLCPQCLIQAGLGTGVGVGPETQEPAGRAPLTAPSLEEVARLFPQFEVQSFIGRGGMGAVYKVRQNSLDRFVALKILPPAIGGEPTFAERFTREAKALAKLNHSGIVTIHDFGQADGLFYLLMEYVDGVSLRQLLQAGRVSPREALAIVPQICDALQYAHDQGIVHRDIKPENILVDRQGRVKVADFGVAKLVDASEHTLIGGGSRVGGLTESGNIVGTPAYMAPEQFERPCDVDHRADIYALGVVFYQMLTGQLPDRPIEPPSKRGLIDVRLDEIVLRALEKDPARRYSQASVLKTQVESLALTTGLQNIVPASWSAIATRFSRKAIAGAGWLVLSAIAGAYLATAGPPLSGGRGLKGEVLVSFGQLLLSVGLSGSFGAPIRGWVAVSEIRHSAGWLRGLGLAAMDGLGFPLLALDFFLFRPGQGLGLNLTGALLLGLTLNILIVWIVWRALHRPLRQIPGTATIARPLSRAVRVVAYGLIATGVLSTAAVTHFWCSRLTDEINLPFVDDPRAVGWWTSVDLVPSPDQFTPETPSWKGALALRGFVLLPGGESAQPWWTWTRGVIIDKDDRTASRYEIKEIDGSRFMFMEWKSQDYIFSRRMRGFYVLRWSAPGEAVGPPLTLPKQW